MPEDSSTGQGLLYPLHREHSDFGYGEGSKLISSNIQGILGVRAATPDGMFRGEYPWNLSFGSGIDRLRHSNLDSPSMNDLIRIAVTDAVAAWEPRASVETQKVGVITTGNGRATTIDVKFRKRIEDGGERVVDVIESTEVRIG